VTPLVPERAQRLLAWGLLLLPLALVLWPHLVRGEVLAAHDNRTEVGLDLSEHLGDSRLFGDQTTLYWPEFWARATLPHEAPIATWNPHNSLGRPLTPSGMGGAFPLTHLINWATPDPFRQYTYWALSAVLISMACAYGFLRALSLRPEAAAAAALAISLGPIFGGYQVVPLIQWGYAFAFMGLWAVESFLTRPAGLPLLALSASVYGIVLAGFPQHVLLMAYPAATWTVIRLFQTSRGATQVCWRAGALMAALLLGLVSLAPPLWDMWVDWSESSRGAYATISFAASTDWREGVRFLASLVAAPWRHDQYARSISLTPLFAGLALLGAADRRPTSLAWSLWSLLILIASLLPAASLALRWLGISFSEWPHVYAAQLPLALLSAQGAHRALGQGRAGGKQRLALVSLPLFLFGACLPLSGFELDVEAAALTAASAVLTLCFAYRPSGWLLLLAAWVAFAGERQALVHWMAPGDIQRDSPLAKQIRELTPQGARFAWIGPRPPGDRFLLPNIEIPLGLRSIHGYDHLVGRRFESWAGQFADKTYRSQPFQRRFHYVDETQRFLGSGLDATGVSLVVSLLPIEHPRLGRGQRLGPVVLQRVLRPRPLACLIPAADYETVAGELRLTSAGALRRSAAVEFVAGGTVDRLRFRFAANPVDTLLFVSQQHHPDWHARWAGGALETLPVDGVFEGILVPAGCGEVELTFERRIGYSLCVQAAYAAGFLALLAWRMVNRSPGLETSDRGHP
jgi:hypothetical protein